MAAPLATAGASGAPAPPPANFQIPDAVTNLSPKLNHAWQLIDFGHRQIKKGLDNGAIYQQPEAASAVEAWVADGDKIIAKYSTAKNTMGPEGTSARVAPASEDATYVDSSST